MWRHTTLRYFCSTKSHVFSPNSVRSMSCRRPFGQSYGNISAQVMETSVFRCSGRLACHQSRPEPSGCFYSDNILNVEWWLVSQASINFSRCFLSILRRHLSILIPSCFASVEHFVGNNFFFLWCWSFHVLRRSILSICERMPYQISGCSTTETPKLSEISSFLWWELIPSERLHRWLPDRGARADRCQPPPALGPDRRSRWVSSWFPRIAVVSYLSGIPSNAPGALQIRYAVCWKCEWLKLVPVRVSWTTSVV